jgi:hypothetical protein
MALDGCIFLLYYISLEAPDLQSPSDITPPPMAVFLQAVVLFQSRNPFLAQTPDHFPRVQLPMNRRTYLY